MYGKIFSKIFDGSLMWQPIPVRYAFMSMIALADEDGFIDMHDRSIARRIYMDEAEFKDAVKILSAPDPESRTKDNEGRRIERWRENDFGWYVLNYGRYRDIAKREDRRKYQREYQKEYKEKMLDGQSNKQSKTIKNIYKQSKTFTNNQKHLQTIKNKNKPSDEIRLDEIRLDEIRLKIPSPPDKPPKKEKKGPNKKKKHKITDKISLGVCVEEIFNYWAEATGRDPSRVRLTQNRKNKIKKRLEIFTPEELERAIDGISRSAFHQGENPAGKRWDHLEDPWFTKLDKLDNWVHGNTRTREERINHHRRLLGCQDS